MTPNKSCVCQNWVLVPYRVCFWVRMFKGPIRFLFPPFERRPIKSWTDFVPDHVTDPVVSAKQRWVLLLSIRFRPNQNSAAVNLFTKASSSGSDGLCTSIGLRPELLLNWSHGARWCHQCVQTLNLDWWSSVSGSGSNRIGVPTEALSVYQLIWSQIQHKKLEKCPQSIMGFGVLFGKIKATWRLQTFISSSSSSSSAVCGSMWRSVPIAVVVTYLLPWQQQNLLSWLDWWML